MSIQYYPRWIQRPDGAKIIVPNREQHEVHVGYPVTEEGNPRFVMLAYPCGCGAGPGPFDMPRYCPEHGKPEDTVGCVLIPSAVVSENPTSFPSTVFSSDPQVSLEQFQQALENEQAMADTLDPDTAALLVDLKEFPTEALLATLEVAKEHGEMIARAAMVETAVATAEADETGIF